MKIESTEKVALLGLGRPRARLNFLAKAERRIPSRGDSS